MNPEGITIKRRNLPHWHKDYCIQFVTFHLADSLPSSVRRELQLLRESFLEEYPEPWPQEVSERFNKLLPAAANDYLDAGYGCCCLKRPECAKIVADAITHFDNERYMIHKYVVMPNHVHVLVELNGTSSLSEICKSWKNFTALQINRILGQSGQFWHHESWDTMIRNDVHYLNVVNYMEKNIRRGGVVWG